jgi:hypothetical protein
MQKIACTRLLGTHLVDGAGNWVQQEQPDEVGKLPMEFLRESLKSRIGGDPCSMQEFGIKRCRERPMSEHAIHRFN